MRELDVLARMAPGKSNAAIAGSLFLTKRGVEKHVNGIFSKLDLPEESIRRAASSRRSCCCSSALPPEPFSGVHAHPPV